MQTVLENRRRLLKLAAMAGSGVVMAGTGLPPVFAAEQEKEVTATEDLMREHGVLRRALLVYRAAAERLLHEPAKVPAGALAKTAKLFRTFGEDYHERKLEEELIFPMVSKLDDPAAAYPVVLKQQHERGRELTDYVLQLTRQGSIPSGSEAQLARALNAFALMYEHHTAREDTVVFVAWKNALSDQAYRDMSEQFEQIERQTFGHDGFADAVGQIAAIESAFGLSDIAQFTIAPPPT